MKKGISLIVLVITIIVIIILAGAVILSLANNNPINSANKAVCLSDVANFKSAVALDFASELSLYTTGTVTYVPSASVVALQSRLQTRYGIVATVDNSGVITFTVPVATTLPAGTLPTDIY
ncbi:MAG: hypothetical protein K0R72_903 [Clostridia bacterium]|jgi:uncharacterized protein YpmB|nr:hypothetical protein [Clostridia bacterium]